MESKVEVKFQKFQIFDTCQVRGCYSHLQKVSESACDSGVFSDLFCCAGLWIKTEFGSPAITRNELFTTKKGKITMELYGKNN